MKSPRALAVVLALTLAVYVNSLRGGFVYDDVSVVQENGYVTSPGHVKDIFTKISYWGRNENSRNYRPVFTFCHYLIYRTFGENPLPFHVWNVLLHLCNTALVFIILRLLAPEGMAPFFTALLFGVHPVHTEAVSNITGGAELLSACFFLLLLYLHARYRKPSALLLAATAILYGLALLSKENTATYLGVLVLVYLYFRERISWAYGIPVLTVTGLYLLARKAVFGSVLGIGKPLFYDNFIAHLPPDAALLTALKVLGLYVVKFVFPLHLSCDYSYPILQAAGTLADAGLIALFLSLFALLYLVKDRLFRFGMVFFLITISIVSNVFFSIGTVMGERLLYLPSVGLCMAAGLWPDRQQRLSIALAVVLLLFSARTVARNQDWRTGMNLWNATLKNGAQSFRAHLNRASEEIELKHYDRARKDLEASLFIHVLDEGAWYTAGRLHDALNKIDSAINCYSLSLEINPLYFKARINRGIDYFILKKFPEAAEDFLKCAARDSTHFYAHFNLADSYFHLKDQASARRYLEKALSLDTASSEARMLSAKISLEEKNVEAALKDLNALLLKGYKPAETRFYISYGHLLAGNIDSAAFHMNRSLELYPQGRAAVMNDTAFIKIRPYLR